MVGCSSRHCLKGYCEGLQKVWNERLYKHKSSQMEKKMPLLNMNL